jgi:hypothetical protein
MSDARELHLTANVWRKSPEPTSSTSLHTQPASRASVSNSSSRTVLPTPRSPE